MSATKTRKTTKTKAAKSTKKATKAALKSIEANIEAIDGTGKKRKAKKADDAKPKKLSALDAAAQVLAEAGQPMNTREMIETLAAKKLWTSPGGKTPHATLYTVVTMLPNTWRPGIDSFSNTGYGPRMHRDGSRGKPLMVKWLLRIFPIVRGWHGRHKNQGENQAIAAADASGGARVCGWSVGEAVVEQGV
jgi:hypothetical protein